MNASRIIDLLVHVGVVLFLPPLLLGVINKTKAFFGGRQGPPVLQLYRDIWRLMRKDTVVSTTTTWVFRAGPVVSLATALVAALLLPLGGAESPLAFSGNFVLFAYLLGLGRFFTIIAALDTGSPFEGMGAAREATFSALAEPALFLGLVVLARASGSLELGAMLGGSVTLWGKAGASLVLVIVSLVVVMLVENSRIPFDDPNTHLELTMIHEVMVLDHSGPMFGMILYGAAMKLLVLGSLVVNLVVPVTGTSLLSSWPLFIVGILALAVVVGVVESSMARLRLVQVPSLLVGACLLSGFGVVMLVR